MLGAPPPIPVASEGLGWDFRSYAAMTQLKVKNVVRYTFYLEKIPILTAMFQAPARYCTGNILFRCYL